MSHADLAPTRRALVTQAASVVALGSSLASSLGHAAETNPDASLIEMVARMRQADQRLQAYNEQTDRAMDNYDSPDIPEAVCFRASDYPNVCFDPSNKCAQYGSDEDWRYVYEDQKALSLWAQQYWSKGEAYENPRFTEADRTRVREVKAAYERWQAAIKLAEDAAGMTKPSELGNRETEIISGLLRQISATPARTPRGLAAKGEAAVIAYIGSLGGLENRLARLLAKPDLEWRERHEIATLSVLIDSVRLSSVGTPPQVRQSAA